MHPQGFRFGASSACCRERIPLSPASITSVAATWCINVWRTRWDAWGVGSWLHDWGWGRFRMCLRRWRGRSLDQSRCLGRGGTPQWHEFGSTIPVAVPERRRTNPEVEFGKLWDLVAGVAKLGVLAGAAPEACGS